MKRIFIFVFFACFVSFLPAQTPQELQSYLPEVPEWKITPEIEIFNPRNLYERINGAAPLFLENNFREMTSMVYTHGDNYITIQAYRHATPTDAFGMYASERSSDMKFFPIGGEAQGDNVSLYTFAGSVYLKIQANNESDEIGETMRKIAKGLTEKIDPQAGYPALFNHFPKEGRVAHSETYMAFNYIGHAFLKNVYTCDYDFYGKKLQGFIIDAKSKDEAENMLKKYAEFTKQTDLAKEGKMVIKDRYNGNIPCVWKGQYIAGIYNETGIDIDNDTLLDLIGQHMENLK